MVTLIFACRSTYFTVTMSTAAARPPRGKGVPEHMPGDLRKSCTYYGRQKSALHVLEPVPCHRVVEHMAAMLGPSLDDSESGFVQGEAQGLLVFLHHHL